MGFLQVRIFSGILLLSLFFLLPISKADEPIPLPRVEISGSVQRDFLYHAVAPNADPYSQLSYDNGGGGGEFVELEVAANRKEPGCERESKFLALVKMEAESGRPMNHPYSLSGAMAGLQGIISDITDLLSGGVKDEKYAGDYWRKMEVAFQYFDADTRTPVRLIAHYWWNQYTYQVDQLKLRNSKSEGCSGQSTFAG